MKVIIPALVMFLLLPMGHVFAAENTKGMTIKDQLNAIEIKLNHLQKILEGRVLGVNTNQLFTVTSNDQVIAQSYVPVTRALADDWCSDMATNEAFGDTEIVCTHEGGVIYKK